MGRRWPKPVKRDACLLSRATNLHITCHERLFQLWRQSHREGIGVSDWEARFEKRSATNSGIRHAIEANRDSTG